MIVLVPLTSILLAQRFKAQETTDTGASSRKITLSSDPAAQGPKEVPDTLPEDELKQNTEPDSSDKPNGSSPSPSPSSPEVFYGPTMNFKVQLEGRPKDKQASKFFVGIAQGAPSSSPQYLLSFNVDVNDSGEYKGLSLAGLTSNESYTAYLKGTAQIATASAFIAKPTISDLGLLKLLSGDLNEDNVINSQDYAIAKTAFRATPEAKNWNKNVDFNLDNVINTLDLSIITKNFGKTGNSGSWYSNTTKEASGSASLSGGPQLEDDVIAPPGVTIQPHNINVPNPEFMPSLPSFNQPTGNGGYWIYVPAR